MRPSCRWPSSAAPPAHPKRVMLRRRTCSTLDLHRKERFHMATLVAIAYPDQGTAEEARGTVQQLEADLIIQADQVASIRRDLEGRYHVSTSHGGASAAGGAVWGGFWGLLFGLLFLVPFAGWALGAGMGALM